MKATLKIWTDARKEAGAERVFQRAMEQIDRVPQNPRTEPYPKTGGYVYSCEIGMECTAWEGCVVEVIELGQRLCYAWTISGDVQQELRGWATQAQAIGIKAAEWTLHRQT
jgi:hypothetical protein